jgi:hypothetical protein
MKALAAKNSFRFRFATHPLAPAILVALIFLFFIIRILIQTQGDYRYFLMLGTYFLDQGANRSELIKADDNPYLEKYGYDGQFNYFLAVDPANSHYYTDSASYRNTRILYPALARLLALGDKETIPITLVYINLAAIVLGTYVLALWLRSKGVSPWYSLIYGFYNGNIVTLTCSLSDTLAYTLVICGVYYLDKQPRRLGLASIFFGMAFLSRETILIFPICYSVFIWLEESKATANIWRATSKALILLASLGPGLVYQLYLYYLYGAFGLGNNSPLENVPLLGLFKLWPWNTDASFVALFAIIPGLVLFSSSIYWMIKRAMGVEVFLLFLNTLFLCLLLPHQSLNSLLHSSRIIMGTVVSALLCLPLFVPKEPFLTTKALLKLIWLIVPALLWLILSSMMFSLGLYL